MAFESSCTVRFGDCDPAGIVFFPQYLVMVNTLVEQWFEHGLGVTYAEVIGARRIGLPTVRLEADFTAISRHGDRLAQRLSLVHLGRSSLQLRHEFAGDDGVRLRARQVVVCTSLDTHRPQPVPDDLRAAMRRYLEEDA
ncbi:MAG: acyl-CoA thioesterase [Gammaproteobacteria bacterium]|uniref:acyl-CoA thioesterase n=1 Tax=Azohydromonas sp. TaxID=1872666 RepID=UPI002CBD846B|nr:thioesterase family protein [Azohydromonas sp.]HMM83964.1 thioesterase family protein [Azohydromonas sp.]